MKFETILSNFEKEGIEVVISKGEEVLTGSTIKNGEFTWDKEPERSYDDWQNFSVNIAYVYLQKDEVLSPLTAIGKFKHWKDWEIKLSDLLQIHSAIDYLDIEPDRVIPFSELQNALELEYKKQKIN